MRRLGCDLQLSVELFVGEALQQVRAIDETALEAVDGARHDLDEPGRVDDDQPRQQRVVGEVDETSAPVKVLHHQLDVRLRDVETSRYRHHLQASIAVTFRQYAVQKKLLKLTANKIVRKSSIAVRESVCSSDDQSMLLSRCPIIVDFANKTGDADYNVLDDVLDFWTSDLPRISFSGYKF